MSNKLKLIVLFSIALFPSICFARAGFFNHVKEAAPVGIGIAGFFVGLIAIFPTIRLLVSQLESASKATTDFISKYKNIMSKDMRADFDDLIYRYDIVLETSADICDRFSLKSMSRMLRNIIK